MPGCSGRGRCRSRPAGAEGNYSGACVLASHWVDLRSPAAADRGYVTAALCWCDLDPLQPGEALQVLLPWPLVEDVAA